MNNCDEAKLEPLFPKENQEQSNKVEKSEKKLQYNVLDYPPFILIISLALQVRFLHFLSNGNDFKFRFRKRTTIFRLFYKSYFVNCCYTLHWPIGFCYLWILSGTIRKKAQIDIFVIN